jgi:DNA-binding NarL/FixJ family response regulator
MVISGDEKEAAIGPSFRPGVAPIGSEAEERSEVRQLSPRQRQVLALVAEGQTNKEIAVVLGVTMSAVKKHLAAMMTLYDVPNRAALVHFAFRQSSIGPAPDAAVDIAPVLENPLAF